MRSDPPPEIELPRLTRGDWLLLGALLLICVVALLLGPQFGG
ncbi:MAG: hypothetical protein M0T72_06665 [Candidatus Dormibacteraeota bacterium]|nr:hypothetical protein [Candidatus Dormibacteraeota bacterium]